MQLEYYQNSRGDCEILNFINNLPNKKYKNAITTQINILEKYGPYVLQETKGLEKIGENLYELKCHYGKTIFRLLFGIVSGRAYIVVVFQKKKQKLEKKFINLANSRIKQKINI